MADLGSISALKDEIDLRVYHGAGTDGPVLNQLLDDLTDTLYAQILSNGGSPDPTAITDLKGRIDLAVTDNDTGEIEGSALNTILDDIADTLSSIVGFGSIPNADHYKNPLQTTAQLTALPEATLDDMERHYVENAGKDYFYDAEAVAGDLAPDDQTGGTGFWLSVSSSESAASIKSKYESNADTNAFTDAEKSKLAGLVGTHYLGTYASEGALTTAHPFGTPGDYAHVDAGFGSDVILYIWDNDDFGWLAVGSGSAETPATIKTKYESNADTNAFTDADHSKLDGIEDGAQVNQSDAEIKTQYENNSNTNAFTDAYKTALDTLASNLAQKMEKSTLVYEDDSIGAGAFMPAATDGPGKYSNETSSRKVNSEGWAFDPATDEYVSYGPWIMPETWTGEWSFRICWRDDGTKGTGNVRWKLEYNNYDNDGGMDNSWTQIGSVVTDAIGSAAGDILLSSPISGSLTPTEGDNIVYLRLSREASDAGDTYDEDAAFLGIWYQIGVTHNQGLIEE